MPDKSERRTGTFLNVPYDFRRPTLDRFRKRVWNPDDPRVTVPKDFGWGWTINIHALLRRLRIVRRQGTQPDR
jgi:hypothetical protein